MDADYDPNAATLEDRNYGLDGRSKKGKRKKNRLRKALEKKKPVFDPGKALAIAISPAVACDINVYH